MFLINPGKENFMNLNNFTHVMLEYDLFCNPPPPSPNIKRVKINIIFYIKITQSNNMIKMDEKLHKCVPVLGICRLYTIFYIRKLK